MVFALSRQINKKKVCEIVNLLCAGNKVFVKYQAQRGFIHEHPFAYTLARCCSAV